MTVTTERPRVRVPGRSRVRRRVVRVLVGLLVVLALVPVAAASYVVVVARQDDRMPTDAILVLGAAQYWSRPSPSSRRGCSTRSSCTTRVWGGAS